MWKQRIWFRFVFLLVFVDCNSRKDIWLKIRSIESKCATVPIKKMAQCFKFCFSFFYITVNAKTSATSIIHYTVTMKLKFHRWRFLFLHIFLLIQDFNHLNHFFLFKTIFKNRSRSSNFNLYVTSRKHNCYANSLAIASVHRGCLVTTPARVAR